MADSMRQELRALYERHLPDLLDLLVRHPETSFPHLLHPSPAYAAAGRKVVLVGQQTFGWEPDDTVAREMVRDFSAHLIDSLLTLYTDFFPPPLRSPFWRAARQIMASLARDAAEDAYVWADLVKVDQAGQRPPDTVDRDWFERFNVMAAEMRILRPDIVFFFTGPYYDDRLVESFPGARLIPVLESNGSIVRVEHPDLPRQSYRTYHPGYLNRNKWHVLDQLVALCQDQDSTAGQAIRPAEALLVQHRAKAALGDALRQLVGPAAMDPGQEGYAAERSANLLPGITDGDYTEDFRGAAGHELDAKMRAAYSSSALAVNTFARWKAEPGQLTLGCHRGFEDIRFEAVRRTGLRGTPPHLDLLAEGRDNVVGVEVKCTEYLQPHPLDFAGGYDGLIARYPALHRVKTEWGFHYLNASQLVKHTLGLLHESDGRPVTLLYLFWEPANWYEYPLFEEHRREVRRFAGLMADGPIGFAAMTFEELWTAWALISGPEWLPGHIAALQARYTVAI